MGINGLLVDVRWEWTGTETTADLPAGTYVLPVLDPESITEEEVVWIADTGPYEIVDVDVDTSMFTITPGLAIDVDSGVEVTTDIGGQPGRAWVCEVILADAERPVEVPLTIHDLAVMPEGGYDPPVVIILSDDLDSVENLPGAMPVIDGVYIDPDTLPPGPQGIPGPPGVNGTPQYTWVKYADTPTTGMSDDPTDKVYMGLSYNHEDPTESNVYTDYQWSKVQGDPGPPAGVIDLSSTTQVLTQPATGGATTPATAVVTGVGTNTTIVAWEYSSDGAGFSTIPPAGASRAGNVVTITGGTMVAKTITVRMTNGAGGISDSLTVSRVVEGAGGAPGPQGPPGVDAYTLILSNEAHTFPGSTTAALAGSTTTVITALKGAVPVNASVSNAAITGKPTGMTTAVTGSPGTPTVTVTVTTALVAVNGVLTIPVVVDGFTFNKLFSWSVSRQGTTGTPGTPGTDGTPRYTWTKYADNATGAGFSDIPTATSKYLGISYNQTSNIESNLYTDYEWSLIQGPQGPTGPTGPAGPQGGQGIPGPAGTNGESLYTWLKYADSPTTGMSDSPVNKTYMGVSYNRTSPAESNVYTDYSWSLIVGPQGNQGIQGPAGPNGQPTYTWIKYAPNGNPTSLQISDTPGTLPYIGIAYNKTTAAESIIPTDYEWSLIQGPQGPQGPPGMPGAVAAPPASPALTITPQDNGFVIQAGPIDIYSTLAYHVSTASNFTPGPTTVVLSGTRNQNVLITAQNGGAAFVRGTTYYFRAVESNNIGSAPPSAQVSGQLRVWTQTDIPDLAKAVTDSTKALTDSAAAQSTANSALVQDSLSSNPIFAAWSGPRPDGWNVTTAAPCTKETTLVRTPPNAVRFNVAPVTQTYIASSTGVSPLPNLEYVTVTVDFMLVSGDLNNAGVMLRWYHDATYKSAYMPLTASFTLAPPTLGQWYRVTRVVPRPAGVGAFLRIDPYLCGGYSLMEAGNVTAKDIIFDQFAMRASTAEEITAYGTPAAIAKSATDLQNYVQSRGSNLVTNGSGALGTNQNFSPLAFTAADTPPGASGSFVFPSGTGQSARFNDEYIPVDPSKTYEFACDMRQVTGQANFYIGYYPYDAYGLAINPYQYAAQANTLTTLAAALNPGDTKITLTSAANWYNSSAAATWYRSMITWDYVDQGGKVWPVNTYSRNWYADIYASGGITGNVITLRVPWAGPAIPAGTSVSNGYNGGTYMYQINNQVGQPVWTHYSNRTKKGAHPSGTPAAATLQFPMSTAKVRIAMLTNYAPLTQPSQMAIANVSVTEVTAGDDALILAQSAQTSANGKNRINYGSVAPNATSPGIPGDVWWVTGPLNTIVGQYLNTTGTGTTSGNVWVEQQLTNATIATLDAAKINTGYLNAQRIAANSLSVGQISGLNTTLGILYEMTPVPILTSDSPIAGSIAWPAFTLKHREVTISVPTGSTLNSWVIYRWNAGVPLIEQSDVQPVLANDDFVLFANNNGVGIRIFSTVLVSGDMIVDGSISATAIGAGQIIAEHLDANAITADMVKSGTLDSTVVMAGLLTVGTGISINPDDGITVDGPSGKSQIPADGSGMSLSGTLSANSLTIEGISKMQGTRNEITNGGSLTLQAAQTPPASPPTVVSEWPLHEIPNLGDPDLVGRFRGLVQFPAEDASTWLTTANDWGNVASIVKLTKQANGDFLEPPMRFDMRVLRPEITASYGGLAVIGTDVYTLGQTTEKMTGASTYRWYVYQWRYTGVASPAQSRFTYVRRWLHEPSTKYGGYSRQPGIGTDGTEILIFQSNSDDLWGMSRYTAATGAYIATTPLYQDAAHTNRVTASRVGQQVIATAADLGGPVLWWVINQDHTNVYCFDTTGTRQIQNEFSAPGLPVTGFWWDGTRFMGHDDANQKVYDYSRIKDTDLVTNPVKAVQTWRLNNDTDAGGLFVGDYATYETAASPVASYTNLKKRSFFRLNSPGPIPDDPGDANDPDSLTFYMARGATPAITSYCRITPFTGVNKTLTTVLLDTLPTVVAPPPNPIGNFPTAGVTPAVIKSSAGGGNPNWQFQGDGSWDLAPLGSHSTKSTATLAQKYDTGWQELAAVTGFTKIYARWRRIGALVTLEVNVTNNVGIAVTAQGSVTNQYMIAALPVEVWPRQNCNGMLALGSGGGLGMGYVSSTTGQTGIASADATGTARTIAVGSPLVGTFTWMI
jgi:hypothetical protein